MFFEAAQFLKFFILSPVTWILAGIVATFMAKRRRVRIGLAVLTVVVFAAFTNETLFNVVQRHRLEGFTNSTATPGKVYKVAIVLGGFSRIGPDGHLAYVDDRGDRLWEAVRLYRTGAVEKILITGDPSIQLDDDGDSTTEEFLDYMEQEGVPRGTFILEQNALNTRQNAANSVALLKKAGIADSDCLLITSALHMKRAKGCFAKEGFSPAIHPVTIPQLPEKFNHRALYPRWSTAVEWEEVLNELIGDVAYKAAGYM